MTTSEIDSKRPRLASYDRTSSLAGPPPPPHPHPHSHPHHPPPPPPPHPSHRHRPRPPPPQPLHPVSPTQPERHRPHLSPPASAEPRYGSYVANSKSLPEPMHSYQSHESTDPIQHHHGSNYHARQYSNEPNPTRTPTTPSQPGSAVEPNVKTMPAPMYGDPYRGQHDHPPPPAYHPHDHPNHPAVAMSNSHEPPRGHPPYLPVMHQPPESPYDISYYGGHMVGVHSDGQPRRKAVRASQACENCRAKKCKCDEEKPECSNCKQNGAQCVYRNVPPPKQERTMMQVMDQISQLGAHMHELSQRLDTFHDFATYTTKERQQMDSFQQQVRGELRELREDIRSSQTFPKPSSDGSASSNSHHHYHSPHTQPKLEHRPNGIGVHRDSASAASPPASHRSDPETTTGTNMAPPPTPRALTAQKHVGEPVLDESIQKFDPLNGQLSIPRNHTTAAHKLLTHWTPIREFCKGTFDGDMRDAKDYVMSQEKTRGVLRIFGQGEGHDNDFAPHKPSIHATSPPLQPDDDCSSSVSVQSDGYWGTGFDTAWEFGSKSAGEDCAGGLNPDGSFNFDPNVIHRLTNSFLDHIWIMHPFVNRTRLRQIVQKFIDSYSPRPRSDSSSRPINSPFSDASMPSPGLNQGFKRKRSQGAQADFEDHRWYSKGPVGTERRPIERSVNNAIVLLILALGKVCEYQDKDQPLPCPVSNHSDRSESFSFSPRANAPSPMQGAKSPSSTPWSASTPFSQFERLAAHDISRTPSQDSHGTSARRRMRNVDRLPGLAYHTYATEILGEQHGSPDIAHVQACLLAGLYHGQLARVIDSWRWIHSACTAVQLLFKDPEDVDSMENEELADTIKMTFWTGLQLESDILAELDLPASGISTMEERMKAPSGPKGSNAEDVEYVATIMHYYWAQIHLRKILNRAHSSLYNSTERSITNPGWTIVQADDLATQLEDWRNTLSEKIKWDHDDILATDINDARLRAKYYGARYIVHRPFLHHLLEAEHSSPHNYYPDELIHSMRQRQDIVAMSLKCVNAAVKSTRAFDGLSSRPIVTNIFGTTHAQFGNMLVLCALRSSFDHAWMINAEELLRLLHRTVKFISNIAPLSPTMRTNTRILLNAWRKLEEGNKFLHTAADQRHQRHSADGDSVVSPMGTEFSDYRAPNGPMPTHFSAANSSFSSVNSH